MKSQLLRVLCRMAVALVLATAAVAKLIAPGEGQDLYSMLAAATGGSRRLTEILSALLEISLSIGVVVPRFADRGSVVAFAGICVMASITLMLGDGFRACGCFGAMLQLDWREHLLVLSGLLACSAIGLPDLRGGVPTPAAPLAPASAEQQT